MLRSTHNILWSNVDQSATDRFCAVESEIDILAHFKDRKARFFIDKALINCAWLGSIDKFAKSLKVTKKYHTANGKPEHRARAASLKHVISVRCNWKNACQLRVTSKIGIDIFSEGCLLLIAIGMGANGASNSMDNRSMRRTMRTAKGMDNSQHHVNGDTARTSFVHLPNMALKYIFFWMKVQLRKNFLNFGWGDGTRISTIYCLKF